MKKTVWIVWQGFKVLKVCETKEEARKVAKKNIGATLQETLDDFRD